MLFARSASRTTTRIVRPFLCRNRVNAKSLTFGGENYVPVHQGREIPFGQCYRIIPSRNCQAILPKNLKKFFQVLPLRFDFLTSGKPICLSTTQNCVSLRLFRCAKLRRRMYAYTHARACTSDFTSNHSNKIPQITTKQSCNRN